MPLTTRRKCGGQGSRLMAVTLREVAQAAGVSTAAVSKVLHGRGGSVRVSEERAVQIRKIAENLEYRPNAVARNLRSSRTHTVGLIFENFWNISGGPLYYLHLLDGIASPLFRSHYRLTILPEIAQDDILASLGDGQLEGVIWCKLPRDPETIDQIGRCPIPIVAMSTPPTAEPSSAVFVSCDNEGGAELAVEHLWSLGHRKILFLRESEESSTPDCVARMDGLARALSRRGSRLDPEDVATWSWGLSEFGSWWDSTPPHTAVLCWSESAAGRLLSQARAHGVDVPGRLSVVGFDSTQYCETTTPTLTAVKQPIFDMARHASETLLSMIRGNRPKYQATTFPCTLDVRGSTAPPSAREEEKS